jgi:DNA-binding CsgD family transcriptional regulator
VVPAHDAARLAEIVAGAETLLEYERAVLEVVRSRVDFEVAMFKRAGGLGAYPIGLDPAVVRACDGWWTRFAEEIVPVVEVAMGQRRVAVDREVFGIKRLERQDYYQRLMRLHGGRATAIVCLTQRGRAVGTLALGRLGDFSDTDLECLRALAPTLSLCEAAVRAPLLPAAARAVLAPLTPREREVLAHLHLGYTNAQIATVLGTAERTVRNQLSSIYEKLGVSSRAEAAALSATMGLGTVAPP